MTQSTYDRARATELAGKSGDATRYLGMFFIWLGGVVIGASLHLFGVWACVQ